MFPKVLSKTIPSFHNEIYTLLNDDSIKRRAIIAPRGHSKSTLGSFVYPMHKICFNDPEKPRFIVIVSESQDQAANFLNNIKVALEENPRISHYFGNLVGDSWTQTDITTSNNVRVKALGTGQRIRGINFKSVRPTEVILDDFESELNSLTEENRNRNSDWVAGAVEPSLDDDGVLTCIGTVVHQATFLNHLKDDKQYKVLFYQALDGGKPIWPERFSQKRLNNIRASYKARGLGHMFFQEYMNDPVNRDEQKFKEEDLRYWDGGIHVVDGHPVIKVVQEGGRFIEKPVSVYLGVDLAISSRGDYSVIVPVAVDDEENYYVDDYFRARVQPDELIEELFRMRFRFAPDMFIIETTAYQQALVTFLRKEMRERNTFFPIREVKPRLAKDIRLEGMQPYFRAHKVFIKHHHDELVAELSTFPRGRHDDLLDGLHNAISHASAPMRSWINRADAPDPSVGALSWREV